MEILALKQNEGEAVVSLKKDLEKKYKLVDFRIFGSKARGESSEESDIDIMIELEEVTPAIEAVIDTMIFKVNLKYDCLISAVIYSRQELEEGPMSESPLYKVIEREGIKV